MGTETRKTGIDIVGEVPWGTHLCQFYKNREDLIDILVPYFKAGLRNNEFCMWVTSEPLESGDARKALKKAVKNLDEYVQKGQIEILDASEWYTKSGKFDAARVLQGWAEKEKEAMSRGFDGLRLTGNTFWLEDNDRKDFMEYEAAVDRVIRDRCIVAICSYSLEKCSASDIIDVVGSHQFALIRRNGDWERIEGAGRKWVEHKLTESEKKYSALVEQARDGINVVQDGIVKFANKAVTEITGYSKEELTGMHFLELVLDDYADLTTERHNAYFKGRIPQSYNELRIRCKDGGIKDIEANGTFIEYDGKPAILGITRDVTGRKLVEEALRESEEWYKALVATAGGAGLGICVAQNTHDREAAIVFANEEYCRMLGYSRQELLNKSVWDILAPSVLDTTKDLYRRRQDGEKVMGSYEGTMIRKDGSFLPVEVSLTTMLYHGEVATAGFIKDITERMQAAKMLQESEGKYRTLVETSIEGIGISKGNQVVFANRALLDILGYETMDEFIRVSMLDLTAPESVDLVRERIEKRNKSEAVAPCYELKLKRRDGEIRDIEISTAEITLEGEKYVQSTFRDITERKKAEEHIRYQANLVENVSDAIISTDLDFNIVSWNKAAETIYGWHIDEVIGKQFGEVTQPEYPYAMREDILEQFSGEGQWKGEAIHKHKDGTPIDILSSVTLIRDGSGNPVGAVTINRDITERKRAEEALRNSRYMLQTVLDSIPAAVFWKDRDSIYLGGNRTWLEMIGLKSSEEVVGKSDYDLPWGKKQADSFREYDRRVMESGIPEYDIIEPYLRTDDTQAWAKTNKVPLRDTEDNVVGILGTYEDITEHKRAEEVQARLLKELQDTNRAVSTLYSELEEKARHLRQADEMKSRLLYQTSHELRTPLSSILNLSQILLDHLDGDLTPEQEKQVSFIHSAARNLTDLVSDLLNMAKMESGTMTVRPSQFEVSDLFSTLRGMLKPLDLNPPVELIFEEPSDIPTLYTDEGKVSQILRNLISNALKFTERGEIRISAATDISSNTVVLSVTDTGTGIAPEDRERIFDEFTVVNSHLQQQLPGTGLGLPVSRRLAELLGGSILVESEVGAGSTFSVVIPVVYKNYPEVSGTFFAGPRPVQAAGHSGPISEIRAVETEEKLLIIDDEEVSRYALRRLLADIPCTIVEAANGHDGLSKARKEQPNAIFLDLIMPGMSGFEVLDKLKADPATRDIPVIVWTAKALEKKELRRLGNKAAAVLSKETKSRKAAVAEIQDALVQAGLGGDRQGEVRHV